jgi:hypothetical protein
MNSSLVFAQLGFLLVVIGLILYAFRTRTFYYLPGQKLSKMKWQEAVLTVAGWTFFVLALIL